MEWLVNFSQASTPKVSPDETFSTADIVLNTFFILKRWNTFLTYRLSKFTSNLGKIAILLEFFWLWEGKNPKFARWKPYCPRHLRWGLHLHHLDTASMQLFLRGERSGTAIEISSKNFLLLIYWADTLVEVCITHLLSGTFKKVIDEGCTCDPRQLASPIRPLWNGLLTCWHQLEPALAFFLSGLTVTPSKSILSSWVKWALFWRLKVWKHAPFMRQALSTNDDDVFPPHPPQFQPQKWMHNSDAEVPGSWSIFNVSINLHTLPFPENVLVPCPDRVPVWRMSWHWHFLGVLTGYTKKVNVCHPLHLSFQFGDYPAACPVAALLQGTSIFVSTLSITAIALDRRQLIVHPHQAAPGIRAMLACVPLIWALALTLAAPMAIWKKLEYWTEWTNLVGVDDRWEETDVPCHVEARFLRLSNEAQAAGLVKSGDRNFCYILGNRPWNSPYPCPFESSPFSRKTIFLSAFFLLYLWPYWKEERESKIGFSFHFTCSKTSTEMRCSHFLKLAWLE